MPTAVVTGGAGFIGSNLSRELVRRGWQVRVLDNFSTGKKGNLEGVEAEIFEADITDLEATRTVMQGADYVFHQAALPSVPRSIADPVASNRNNIDGTLNVLVAARDAKVKRLVYAASSSAYGNADAEYKSEELPARPLSPYALTKFVGEQYCRLFTRLYGLETVALRYFNVFGPRQDPQSEYAAVIPRFVTAMLRGESPVIYGDGEQSRDFTFVANNVEANILAATAEQGAGEVINIACGSNVSLNRLAELINAELGTDLKPRYEPSRPGDVRHSKASVRKAKELIGYEPLVSFEEGLKETIRWYRNLPA